MNWLEWLGSFVIIASVVLIGFGSAGESKEGQEISLKDLLLALGFGLISGIVLTANSVNIKFIIDTIKYPVE
jgi:drug/metabolite transporter (DMT)-like permease